MSNLALHTGKMKKSDEFYTRACYIEAELKHYKEAFAGKIVYCNCDDPNKSAFVSYFKEHFEELGLKALIASCIEGYAMYKTASCETYSKAEEPIGFESAQALKWLEEADIVVSNPPFSKLRSYVQTIVKYEKDMLIVGNINAIADKIIFPMLQSEKLRLGVNHGTMIFDTKDGEQGLGNICWFTSLVSDEKPKAIEMTQRYVIDNYPLYANFGAIDVRRVKDIPCNYYGIMGVPVTYMLRHNPDVFEIVGYGGDADTMERLGADKMGEATIAAFRMQGNNSHITANMRSLYIIKHGEFILPFSRILIRRKI